jgi:hypothetical protein
VIVRDFEAKGFEQESTVSIKYVQGQGVARKHHDNKSRIAKMHFAGYIPPTLG